MSKEKCKNTEQSTRKTQNISSKFGEYWNEWMHVCMHACVHIYTDYFNIMNLFDWLCAHLVNSLTWRHQPKQPNAPWEIGTISSNGNQSNLLFNSNVSICQSEKEMQATRLFQWRFLPMNFWQLFWRHYPNFA